MTYQYRQNGINPFYTYEKLGKTSIQMNESDYQVITDFINGIKPLVVYRDDKQYSVYCILDINDYKISYNKDNIYISSDIYTHEFKINFFNNEIMINDCGRGSAWRGYLIKSQAIKKLNGSIEITKKHLKELNDLKKGLDK
jgi:hypothetical protein